MKGKILIVLVVLLLGGNRLYAQGTIVSEEGFDYQEVPENTTQINSWLEEFDPMGEVTEMNPYTRVRVPKQRAWDYPHLREADVAYHTRMDRIIDMRQKMNILLRHPKHSLPKLLYGLALSGDFPVYSDRDMQNSMDKSRVLDLIVDTFYTDVVDPTDPYGPTISIPVPEILDFEKIQKIRVQEDWIFDKVHGRMIPRIAAIAPIYRPTVANGSVELAEQPLFWMKYSDLRGSFANFEVFNKNMAARISMDHFFQARMFDSYIVKEQNVSDMDIRYYPEFEDNTLGALLKSEEVKNDLFILEHDLWEF